MASAVASWGRGCLATATASTLTSGVGVSSSFAFQPGGSMLAITRAVSILAVVFRILRIGFLVPSGGSHVSLLKFSCQSLQLSKGDMVADRRIYVGGLCERVGVLRIHNLEYGSLASRGAHVGEAQAI